MPTQCPSKERTAPDSPLAAHVRSGFAFPNADLPDIVRLAIKNAYRDGDLSILVATSTLSQGVNLPTLSATDLAVDASEAEGQRLVADLDAHLLILAAEEIVDTDDEQFAGIVERVEALAAGRDTQVLLMMGTGTVPSPVRGIRYEGRGSRVAL